MGFTHVNVSVLVEAGQSLCWGFDVLCRQIANAAILDHSYQPPVTVAVVEEHHGVALSRICLPLDRGHKGSEGIHEIEIDVLYVL